MHHKRAELSVNSTDRFSRGPLGSGNIPKILFETARCHLQSQSSGLDGSEVMDRCCAVTAPGLPCNSNICSDPGNLCLRGGRFLSGGG